MKSMTGYGRARQTLHERDITVELRAVNHRYLDVNVKVPRIYGFLEDAAKTAVGKMIARGKVDVFISIDSSALGDVKISLNHKILESYLDALLEMRDQYALMDDISVMRLARLPDVFSSEKLNRSVLSFWETGIPMAAKVPAALRLWLEQALPAET